MSEEELRLRYPAVVEIPVQWGEQDGFGHVNNAVFVRWFESSRIEYLRLLGISLNTGGVGPILAAVTCNFRCQVTYPDSILIGARVSQIGNSSVGMHHAAWSRQQGKIVADGDSTVVMFDYELQKSSPLDLATRQAITRLQGELDGKDVD